MGIANDREMLEAAQRECVRLEQELAETKGDLAEARKILGYHGEALPQMGAELHVLRAKVPDAWDEGARRVIDWNKSFPIAMPTDNPYRAPREEQP